MVNNFYTGWVCGCLSVCMCVIACVCSLQDFENYILELLPTLPLVRKKVVLCFKM